MTIDKTDMTRLLTARELVKNFKQQAEAQLEVLRKQAEAQLTIYDQQARNVELEIRVQYGIKLNDIIHDDGQVQVALPPHQDIPLPDSRDEVKPQQ